MRERPSSLPARRARLIGRDPDLLTLRDLVLHGDGRLTTLTGAGGAGKTSLALEAARALEAELPDGVLFVDLSAVEEAEGLAEAACIAAGLADQTRPPEVVLAEFLEARQALLLLDNCEHLVAPVARLVDSLLDTCPDLRVVATSRMPLRVRGEKLFAVQPLAVVDGGAADAGLESSPAIELFVERARRARGDLTLGDRGLRSAAAICELLGGLPLAIELAAAHAGALSLSEIEQRLSASLPLPMSGRGGPARHRTIEAALDWSHRLLDEREAAIFRRLAVFTDGWTLDAAETVCAIDCLPSEVSPALAALVEASLVVVEMRDGARFRFLAPIGEYARRRLEASGEIGAVSLTHARFYLALAERREPGTMHAGPADLDRIAAEHENVHAALRWAERSGVLPIALAATRALAEYWRVRGLLRHGARHLETQLAAVGGDVSFARGLLSVGLANYRQLLGEHEDAVRLAEAGLAVAEAIGEPRLAATAYGILGDVAMDRADYELARTWYGRARPLIEATPASATALGFWEANVGSIALRERRLDDAEGHFERAIELLSTGQGVWYLGHVLAEAGTLSRLRGDIDRAEQRLADALEQLLRFRAGVEAIDALEETARLALDRSAPLRAATLFGAASALREATGVALSRRRELAQEIDRARRSLPPEAYAAAWASGRAFTLREAAAFAGSGPAGARAGGNDTAAPAALAGVADSSRIGGNGTPSGGSPFRGGAAATVRVVPARPARGASTGMLLTPREHEVAALVGQGLTNRQIGERLQIATGTARIHVERILGKLGLTSRVQIAMWVLGDGHRDDLTVVPPADGSGGVATGRGNLSGRQLAPRLR